MLPSEAHRVQARDGSDAADLLQAALCIGGTPNIDPGVVRPVPGGPHHRRHVGGRTVLKCDRLAVRPDEPRVNPDPVLLSEPTRAATEDRIPTGQPPP